jgi:glycosyltransferase involved in cell wall biosynthesis
MPVFNGQTTLMAAIESILAQTYQNFELIIIDDGSRDRSLEVIKLFTDERIRVFTQVNMGLAKTLNVGIYNSNGDFIARQDQDDISMPTRIEKQVKRFIQNMDLVLLGTRGHSINDEGKVVRKINMPSRNLDLQYITNFYNPFIHTSIMMRSMVLKQIGGYTEEVEKQPPEDYELWGRLKRMGQIENLNESLVRYRVSKNSMSRKFEETIATNYKKIVVANLEDVFHFSKNDAVAFFELQYLKQNKFKISLKFKILFKFVYGFILVQTRSTFFGLRVYTGMFKMILRICFK